MSDTTTSYVTYGDISPRTAALAVVELLKRGTAESVVDRFGVCKPVPRNKSLSLKWRRYEPLARAVTPLTEGVTPPSQKLSKTDISATLHQYGSWVELTDVIQDTHEDPVLRETTTLIGEMARETLEALKIGILNAGTNKFFCGGSSTATVNRPPALADFRKIYRSFKRVHARMITEAVNAGPNISTEPIGASYIVMGHTDLDADFRSIAGFIPVEKYSKPSEAMPYEIGKIENFRIILTSMFEPTKQAGATTTTMLTNGANGSGSADVYKVIVVARDAYAFTPLAGRDAMHIYVHNPTPCVGDQLAQKAFVSWKTWHTGAILNDAYLAVLECTASGLADTTTGSTTGSTTSGTTTSGTSATGSGTDSGSGDSE